MRYIKVFLLVLIFLLVMMFFVQNQASFADPVVLRFDPLFFEPMQSMPLPLYAIMLLCFSMGALLVLLMLMWDRITMMSRLTTKQHKLSGLEKQVAVLETKLAKSEEERIAAEAMLEQERKDAEQRVNAALRAAGNKSAALFENDVL